MFFFFQAEDGIRDVAVTGVQTCALPISAARRDARDPGERIHLRLPGAGGGQRWARAPRRADSSFQPHRPGPPRAVRSEEHTSELQSRLHLVCRLLLEKKKKTSSCYLLSFVLNYD